jgi:DNA-binding transcriptional regulator PaaX
MRNKDKKSLRENIENFLYSDSAPAMATKFVLMLVAVGGVAFGGALIPGILKVINEFDSDNDYSDKKVKNAVEALRRRKFIKIIKNKDGKIKVKLTNKGKKRIKDIFINDLKICKPKVWDKKWRILIFDIPNKMPVDRNYFRSKIKKLGFYQFQGSVWFYPYPCEDEILAIAEFFKVSEYIEIIIAKHVLHEKELKEYFKI